MPANHRQIPDTQSSEEWRDRAAVDERGKKSPDMSRTEKARYQLDV